MRYYSASISIRLAKNRGHFASRWGGVFGGGRPPPRDVEAMTNGQIPTSDTAAPGEHPRERRRRILGDTDRLMRIVAFDHGLHCCEAAGKGCETQQSAAFSQHCPSRHWLTRARGWLNRDRDREVPGERDHASSRSNKPIGSPASITSPQRRKRCRSASRSDATLSAPIRQVMRRQPNVMSPQARMAPSASDA